MVSIEDKTKPDMKHMVHDENASSAKEEEGSARDDIAAIDEKLESRIKYVISIFLTPSGWDLTYWQANFWQGGKSMFDFSQY